MFVCAFVYFEGEWVRRVRYRMMPCSPWVVNEPRLAEHRVARAAQRLYRCPDTLQQCTFRCSRRRSARQQGGGTCMKGQRQQQLTSVSSLQLRQHVCS